MPNIKASVIGASGYGGAEAVRLLTSHPCVDLIHVTAETQQRVQGMTVRLISASGREEGLPRFGEELFYRSAQCRVTWALGKEAVECLLEDGMASRFIEGVVNLP